MTVRFAMLMASAACVFATLAAAAEPDWPAIDRVLGRPGSVQAAGIHRYGLPRSDLDVTVDGVTIKPGLALGGWVAFEPMPSGGAMLMGDLVLKDTEISPVMAKLLEGGLEVTAIHNHLLRTSIPVFYMHVGGHGDPVQLAGALHAALEASATPLTQPSAGLAPPALDLDTAALDRILGASGKANGGVYQFGIPRAETITEGGAPVPGPMGTGTAINFQPTGNGKAAISGDFVLLAGEVNPVMKMLRHGGIEVTALHSHMVDETPRLYFMHFWANDDAQKLALGVKAALSLVNLKLSD